MLCVLLAFVFRLELIACTNTVENSRRVVVVISWMTDGIYFYSAVIFIGLMVCN